MARVKVRIGGLGTAFGEIIFFGRPRFFGTGTEGAGFTCTGGTCTGSACDGGTCIGDACTGGDGVNGSIS